MTKSSVDHETALLRRLIGDLYESQGSYDDTIRRQAVIITEHYWKLVETPLGYYVENTDGYGSDTDFIEEVIKEKCPWAFKPKEYPTVYTQTPPPPYPDPVPYRPKPQPSLKTTHKSTTEHSFYRWFMAIGLSGLIGTIAVILYHLVTFSVIRVFEWLTMIPQDSLIEGSIFIAFTLIAFSVMHKMGYTESNTKKR